MKLIQKHYRSLSFLFVVLLSLELSPLSVGSTTAVTWQGATVFPSADLDNKILGFTFMTSGFALQDSATTCTYDAVLPVVGDVALNGGTLFLNQDLVLDNVASVTSLGNIWGGSHSLNLASMLNEFGSPNQGAYNFTNLELTFNSDVTFEGNILFNGSSIIDGQFNVLDLSATASLVVASGSTLTLRNITIQGLQERNISCFDDSAQLILDNVTFVLNNDFLFDQGSILFNNNVDLVGSYTFNYDSLQTSIISANSSLNVRSGVRLEIGRSNAYALNQPLDFVDATSVLQFENSTLSVENGWNITRGTLEMVRDVVVEIISTSTADGVTLGDGTQVNDAFFQLYPGSTVIFTKGYLTFDLTNLNLVKSRADTARIVREVDSVFYIEQNLVLNDFGIQVDEVSSVLFAPGAWLRYDNVSNFTPIGNFNLSGYLDSGYQISLRGNGDNVFMLSGSLPFNAVISGIANSFIGTGNIVLPVVLEDGNAALTWGLNGSLNQNIIMNGGTLNLASNLPLGVDVILSGSGAVNLDGKIFTTGVNDLTWNDQINWSGVNGTVHLRSNLKLDNIWTFSGDCTIDGGGFTIDLNNGNIVVAPNSVLTISNATIENLLGNAISCADETATVILSNVTWIQNGDFYFNAGALQFDGTNYLSGSNNLFIYESSVTSTIMQNSWLFLDTGITFSYDPSIAATNLIEFIDNTSNLILNGGSLHATVTGLELTNGSLLVQSSSTISSQRLSGNDQVDYVGGGITFGNENSNNDMNVAIFNGVTLLVNSGLLNYKNVNANSFNTENPYSQMVMNTGTTLNVYQTLPVGQGRITFNDNSALAVAPGMTVAGSIAPLGIFNTYVLVP